MITIRKSSDRGLTETEWLKGLHTFSFGGYLNRKWMAFNELRVINEDVIAPSGGFPTHPHNDMEILTYLVSGALSHKDSIGTVHTIFSGEVQGMSAGTGVTHSEFNGSDKESAHLLQIWIIPRERGLKPSYQEWKPKREINDELIKIAGPQNNPDTIFINQDIEMYVGKFNDGKDIKIELPQKTAWLQIIEGKVLVNNAEADQGDGVAVELEDNLSLKVLESAHFLLFKWV